MILRFGISSSLINQTSTDSQSCFSNVGPVQVTTVREANVYLYRPRNLSLAYGLAILFTLVSVMLGSYALYRNGVSYDGSFSVCATTMQDEEVGVRDSVDDVLANNE